MNYSTYKKNFDKCPACGSPERFFESIANELKANKLGRPGWTACLDVKSGVVTDAALENKIPIGSTAPGYSVKTDICLNCGCIYAIEISTTPATKHLVPTQPPPGSKPLPGGLSGLPFNNPRFS